MVIYKVKDNEVVVSSLSTTDISFDQLMRFIPLGWDVQAVYKAGGFCKVLLHKHDSDLRLGHMHIWGEIHNCPSLDIDMLSKLIGEMLKACNEKYPADAPHYTFLYSKKINLKGKGEIRTGSSNSRLVIDRINDSKVEHYNIPGNSPGVFTMAELCEDWINHEGTQNG